MWGQSSQPVEWIGYVLGKEEVELHCTREVHYPSTSFAPPSNVIEELGAPSWKETGS